VHEGVGTIINNSNNCSVEEVVVVVTAINIGTIIITITITITITVVVVHEPVSVILVKV
jgi:hypothetical protein